MKNLNHKRSFLLSLALIAVGVSLNTSQDASSLGTVFIALGGFFLIVSMAKKKNWMLRANPNSE
jgi:drug/metabolite transporter superfamily protein YnfA